MIDNFHTHTWRCRHATGTEEEYVQAAIQNEYRALGFSDHTPWEGIYGAGSRMDEDQIEDYVDTINELRQKYAGKIRIHLGLEAEYFPDRMSWLLELKEKYDIEYLIFGNHFPSPERRSTYYGNVQTKEDIYEYLDVSIRGMESGHYCYLAHPDLYLKQYPVYDKSCEDVATQLCRAAKALNVPLEYNILGQRMIDDGKSAGVGYPDERFWAIAAQEGCSAVASIDAHETRHIQNHRYNLQAFNKLLTYGMPLKTLDEHCKVVDYIK
jgi:histidinol-phosphatase (PHP family)